MPAQEAMPTPDAVTIGARITAILLIVLVHVILIWDVYAGMRWGSGATVSTVLHSWIEDYPIIAFSTGVVVGHIVWPLRSPPVG